MSKNERCAVGAESGEMRGVDSPIGVLLERVRGFFTVIAYCVNAAPLYPLCVASSWDAPNFGVQNVHFFLRNDD